MTTATTREYRTTDPLDTLAGPIRRAVLDQADAMPRYLLPVIAALLARFHRCGRMRDLYDDDGGVMRMRPLSTWVSRFARAGYASPAVILRTLRLALAVRLLNQGWTVTAVTYEMHWSSTGAFARTFREATGRTPTARGGLTWESLVADLLSPQRTLALATGAR
jgi:methylphosphotriester-DNA--protein-cysteine methyltransferase